MDDRRPQGEPLLSSWVQYCGWFFLAAQLPFVSRILFESTLLTARHGPQMVGFSLVHSGHNLILLSFLFVPLALLWFVGAFAFGLVKKLRFSGSEWILLLAIAVSSSLLLIPYPVWEHFDVLAFGPGSYGNRFLNDAAFNGDLRLVKRLLADGSAINLESSGGITPLSAAIVGGREEMVVFLLAKGANVNAHSRLSGETPLMSAAETGNMSLLKLLLVHGAEPCATNREGNNASKIAERYHYQEAANYLADRFHCPDPDLPPSSCAGKFPDTCVVVH
jgi:hypothetical protein